MSKIYAYVRVSTDKQDNDNQRLGILEFARQHNMHVDDWIAVEKSSRQSSRERRIDELSARVAPGDTLIVSELSRLGRSTGDVVNLVKELTERKIRVIVIKQNIDISGDRNMADKVIVTMFSLMAELERDILSLRTKEALAAKKRKGVKLGKPKGTIQKSKFDKDRQKIEELLAYGLSVRKIAEVLDYPTHRGLNAYINRRGLR